MSENNPAPPEVRSLQVESEVSDTMMRYEVEGKPYMIEAGASVKGDMRQVRVPLA